MSTGCFIIFALEETVECLLRPHPFSVNAPHILPHILVYLSFQVESVLYLF